MKNILIRVSSHKENKAATLLGFPPNMLGKFFKSEICENVIFLTEVESDKSFRVGANRVISYKTKDATRYLIKPCGLSVQPTTGKWDFTFEEKLGKIIGYGSLVEATAPLRSYGGRARRPKRSWWSRVKTAWGFA